MAGSFTQSLDKLKESFLYAAAQGGNDQDCESLLEIGADVNWKNHDGDTCLLTATRRGHLSTVQLLLLHNANINDVDKNGWNALHICCSKGDINILTLLLDANVNIHTRTNDGLTGYDIAQRHNQLHICNRLENHQQFLLSQNEIIQHSPTNLNSNRTNNNKTRNENILNKNKIVNDIQYPVNIENKNTTQPLSLIYENQSPNERKAVPQNLMEVYLEDKYEIQSMQNQVNSTQNLAKVESMPHNNTLNNHIMTNSMQNIHDEDSCPFIRLYENERKDKKAFQLRMSYINEEYAYSKKEIDLLKQHNEELEDTLTQLQETLVDKETAFQEELENIENIATQKLNNMKEEFVKKQQLLEKKCSQHSNANNNIENMIECFTTIEECEQYENQLKQNIESVSKRKEAIRLEMSKTRETKESRTCIICLENEKSVVLMPCRHMCLCETCGAMDRITQCPLCRKNIIHKISVFA